MFYMYYIFKAVRVDHLDTCMISLFESEVGGQPTLNPALNPALKWESCLVICQSTRINDRMFTPPPLTTPLFPVLSVCQK